MNITTYATLGRCSGSGPRKLYWETTEGGRAHSKQSMIKDKSLRVRKETKSPTVCGWKLQLKSEIGFTLHPIQKGYCPSSWDERIRIRSPYLFIYHYYKHSSWSHIVHLWLHVYSIVSRAFICNIRHDITLFMLILKNVYLFDNV